MENEQSKQIKHTSLLLGFVGTKDFRRYFPPTLRDAWHVRADVVEPLSFSLFCVDLCTARVAEQRCCFFEATPLLNDAVQWDYYRVDPLLRSFRAEVES